MLETHKIFDGLLVMQYKSGDKKALSLLVNRHHHRLCKHAFWYTHDMEAAKDIVQDCWSTIIAKLNTLKDPNVFGSWALCIVTRKSLDFVNRKKKDLQRLQEFRSGPSMESSNQDNESDILKLRRAIRSLPRAQQQVLRLFYTESYPLREIGKILDISEGTVKSRLFHAREKLKTIIK